MSSVYPVSCMICRVLVGGVEGAAEVDVQAVQVLLGETCVFKGMDEIKALSVCVLGFPETFLRGAEHIPFFSIVADDSGHCGGPEFVDCVC